MLYIPSPADYLAAVRLGMGWGTLPTLQGVDGILHWQQWKLRSPVLDRAAAAITEAARRLLA